MTSVVISQPMLFPWVGLFEQIRLADKYVHYSDVQFSKGSFVNRVQAKTPNGTNWLTVPLRDFKLGQRICEVQINENKDWRNQHLELLNQAYAKSPFLRQMLEIVDDVYSATYSNVGDLSRATIAVVCNYFGFDTGRDFMDIRELAVDGSGSQRVLDTVLFLDGDRYITGHGARNYLHHDDFEAAGVRVEYMNYRKRPYPQLHGEFTPYVTILDLIANMGTEGRQYIDSNTTYWKEFLQNV
jgi:hypothetical protein